MLLSCSAQYNSTTKHNTTTSQTYQQHNGQTRPPANAISLFTSDPYLTFVTDFKIEAKGAYSFKMHFPARGKRNDKNQECSAQHFCHDQYYGGTFILIRHGKCFGGTSSHVIFHVHNN